MQPGAALCALAAHERSSMRHDLRTVQKGCVKGKGKKAAAVGWWYKLQYKLREREGEDELNAHLEYISSHLMPARCAQ
jgi:hypothetical protein